jgi:hypothetical protein
MAGVRAEREEVESPTRVYSPPSASSARARPQSRYREFVTGVRA